ncbi:uncharacterized protein LOC121797055 [Salvia splendens]|uniref:uncharacterized protein LOC121797055 n=1 Tax=Salvia splendens TaxID=180675 RepID=UPI001C277073|nr:uncharacterized protein LOC121797055 [Salvia splendens]
MAAAAAAAYRVEEEQVWKCPKHPTKRRRHGVCPICLRDRLITLCPNCGNVRPCPCSAASFSASSSSSSASSSSYAAEPSFTRSRSLAIPFFLRSNPSRLHSASFLSVFRRKGKKAADAKNNGGDANSESNDKIEDFARMISRSRSVGAGSAASGDGSPSSGKGKFWNVKAFRSSSKNHMAADISALNKG